MVPHYERALIVGSGSGLSASLARLFAGLGMRVGLAARNVDKLADLAAETGAAVHACDASRPGEVEALFAAVDERLGPVWALVNNAGIVDRQSRLVDLTAARIERLLRVNTVSAFLCAREAVRRMSTATGGAGGAGSTAGAGGYARAITKAYGLEVVASATAHGGAGASSGHGKAKTKTTGTSGSFTASADASLAAGQLIKTGSASAAGAVNGGQKAKAKVVIGGSALLSGNAEKLDIAADDRPSTE